MKRMVLMVALLLVSAASLSAQQLDSLRTEAVRSRGFIRAAETQATKVIDLIDGFPDSLVFGASVDTLFADDLIPDSAPPEWRVEEPAADSTSPAWVGDGRQLYTMWAWGDSTATYLEDGSLQVTMAPHQYVSHMWPVFQRGETLWLPGVGGWLPAGVHPSEPWVCVEPGEPEGYSLTEKTIIAGVSLGLKVASWTIGIDSTFAQGLNRLPPDCPTGPPPMPTGVVLTQPDVDRLRIVWDPAPSDVDNVLVDFACGAEPTTTRLLSGMATNMLEPIAAPDSTVRCWACVKFKRDEVNSEQGCNHVDVAP